MRSPRVLDGVMVDVWISDTALPLMWRASWAMALGALAVVGVLIVVQAARDRYSRRYEQRLGQLQRMLLIHLETPLSEPQTTFVRQPFDLAILAELSGRVLRVISGKGQHCIQSFIRTLGLERRIDNQLRYGTQPERLAAIELLGALPFSVQHQAMLTERLKTEPDPQIRFAIASSLSKLGNIDVLPTVLASLQDLPQLSPLRVYDVLRRFGASGHDAWVDALHRKDLPKHLTLGIMSALAETPSSTGLNALLPYCYSEQAQLCATAFQALASMGMPVDPIVLAHGANHRDWLVRRCTARCARNARTLPIEVLKQLVADDNWMVSIEAADALAAYGHGGRCILEMLAASASATARRAGKLLAERKDLDD